MPPLSPAFIYPVAERAPDGPLQSPGLGAYALARGLWFGAATSWNYLTDLNYSLYTGNECAVITPESSMHPGSIQFGNGQFSFANADTEVQWAQQRGIFVRGHYLVNGPGANPAWLTTAVTSAATATAVLAAHINAFMAHYKGRLKWLNVVNEAIKPQGGDAQGFVTNPFYQFLGPDPVNGYIAQALRLAKAGDPACKVGLNFDNCDDSRATQAQQRIYVYNACRALVMAGVPLDFVGIEGHLAQDFEANFSRTDWVVWLARMANLGVKLHITELDFQDTTVASLASRDATTSTAINDYIVGALTNPATEVIQVWQLSDKYSWWNNPASGRAQRADRQTYRPTVLSWSNSPKADYTAVKAAINAARPGTLPASDKILFFGQPPVVITSPRIVTTTSIGAITFQVTNNTGGGGGGTTPSLALRSHEPAGMTQFTYRALNSAASISAINGALVDDGWHDQTANISFANESIIADATAPEGPNVYDILYAPSLGSGGNTPVDQYRNPMTSGTYTEIYLAFWVWMSPGFVNENNSGVQKLIFVTDDSNGGSESPAFYLSMQAGIGGAFPVTPELRVQSADISAFNVAPNVVTNSGVALGAWHHIELRIRENTAGQANGIAQLWVNEVLTTDRSNLAYHPAASPQRFLRTLQMRPYYGGGGTAPPANQHIRFNRLYSSIKV